MRSPFFSRFLRFSILIDLKKGGDILKKVYISHPFKNNPKKNMRSVYSICRHIALNMPHILPVSPLNMFSFLNDSNKYERRKALGYCLRVLSLCDEVWVFGSWKESEGCRMEVKEARKLGKAVRFFSGIEDFGSGCGYAASVDSDG